jgi:hypothetical protein
MLFLLPTMTLNNWINNFTTHQTPPPGHPNLPTRGHIHKIINNHRSLTSRTLHTGSIPQKGSGVSIGKLRKKLKENLAQESNET